MMRNQKTREIQTRDPQATEPAKQAAGVALDETASRRFSRRGFLGAGFLGAGTLALAACGSGTQTAARAATAANAIGAATPPPASAQSVTDAEVYLTVLNPAMTGKKGWPVFVPTDVKIPAHSRVTFVVTNFDDATPILPALAQLSGIVGGSISVEPLDKTNPNAKGTPTTLTQVDPKLVSHTFTAPELGSLNVPLPGTSRVRFTVQTGAAGAYAWQCTDPCGTVPDGQGGPMAPGQQGYMRGTITVV